jgi:hypothetical protein
MRKEEKHLKDANASLFLVRFGCPACCGPQGAQGGRSLVLEVRKSLWQEYGLPFYATGGSFLHGARWLGLGTLVTSGVAHVYVVLWVTRGPEFMNETLYILAIARVALNSQ